MDLTSKEARKILKDYYTWYWDEYYERTWEGMSGSFSRLFGVDPSMNMHDTMNKVFGYDDAKPYHEKVDHSLDIRRGIEKGVLIEPRNCSHDEVMNELKKAWNALDIKDLVNGFLYSLSTGRNQYRTALASYLIARVMPEHEAKRESVMGPARLNDACPVCGMKLNEDYVCHIEDSLSRYTLYYPQKATIPEMQTPEYVLFDLKQFKDLPKVSYTEKDVEILVNILKLAESMGDHNNYTALQKLITRSQILDATGNEINVILGVLSVCGVLQTPERKGFAEKFTNIADRRNYGLETEISYPLFHWHGRNGVDKKALKEIFPSCVTEALETDKKDVSLTEVYSKSKTKSKTPKETGERFFTDGKHMIELDDRIRHYYGLQRLDPSWHKEVRYSRLYDGYTRTEVYFEGNSIKKVISEKGDVRGGVFHIYAYTEKDMFAETEDRYLLLPKTSRGSKKPWTPSLLETFTYMGAYLNINFGGSDFFTYNYQNNKRLPLPSPTDLNVSYVRTPIEFYTYTEAYIRSVPDNYEEILNDYLS
ncbi:MAG: hypothetical protein J6X33_01905 [Clostridiales bacterium]|nr:hypothetical protein [Clostridiales bacterium]